MRKRLKFLVLVKAAPVLTRQLDETMCVAGLALDEDRASWIRLHPVPFRDLDDVSRFTKYQEVEVDVIRPKSDRRPESWSPIEGSIHLGERIEPSAGWTRRRHLIEKLPERTMCELIEDNRAGSGPGVPSLAVVRPATPPQLEISLRDEAQVADWHRKAKAAASRISLFEDPSTP